MDDICPVVIDHGGFLMKAGFAGDDEPRAVWSTIVGRPRRSAVLVGAPERVYFIGDEGCSKRGALSLSYPFAHGRVQNWGDMEKMWHHTLNNELRVAPEETFGLFANSPMFPKQDQERMATLLFETFGMPGLSFQIQQVLASISAGRSTGLVLDIGEHQSVCVPVHECTALLDCYQHRPGLGGAALTDYLQKLVNEKEPRDRFNTTAEREIVRDMKEKLTYCQSFQNNGAVPVMPFHTRNYELPDGSDVVLHRELCLVPEALFSPSVLPGVVGGGIHELVIETVQKSPVHLIPMLFTNMALAGGSTMFDQLPTRLAKMIRNHLLNIHVPHPVRSFQNDPSSLLAKLPEDICTFMTGRYCHTLIMVNAMANRNISTWKGGSILASAPEFQKNWITKAQYEEIGPKVIDQQPLRF